MATALGRLQRWAKTLEQAGFEVSVDDDAYECTTLRANAGPRRVVLSVTTRRSPGGRLVYASDSFYGTTRELTTWFKVAVGFQLAVDYAQRKQAQAEAEATV